MPIVLYLKLLILFLPAQIYLWILLVIFCIYCTFQLHIFCLFLLDYLFIEGSIQSIHNFSDFLCIFLQFFEHLSVSFKVFKQQDSHEVFRQEQVHRFSPLRQALFFFFFFVCFVIFLNWTFESNNVIILNIIFSSSGFVFNKKMFLLSFIFVIFICRLSLVKDQFEV